MQLGPRGKSIYTEPQFYDYIGRLRTALFRNGLSSLDIVNDSVCKQYITNWVQTEVIDKKERDKICGVIKTLANMEVHFSGPDRDPIVYPIIHEYKGHHLIKSYYFARGTRPGEVVTAESIPVLKEKAILISHA